MSVEAPVYKRRRECADLFSHVQAKIESLFETHHVSYPEEAELIEALIRMTERRNILELGMRTGFATLHMIRAVNPHGRVTSIDKDRVFDESFFNELPFAFHQGDTVEVLRRLAKLSLQYDFVYIDSDHSLEHTVAETEALMMVTKPGAIFVYHDCPEWEQPDSNELGQVRVMLNGLCAAGVFTGLILPTSERLDLPQIFGAGYDKRLRPHLGVFMRQ